mmetsp:Transcript_29481/g.44758  ORF Transcript_29481/g.44758 Transcript_29481/m.44758 type:complete len:94 (-) Transcript_29481:3957-4238(-)
MTPSKSAFRPPPEDSRMIPIRKSDSSDKEEQPPVALSRPSPSKSPVPSIEIIPMSKKSESPMNKPRESDKGESPKEKVPIPAMTAINKKAGTS